jgi:hypothetical protein
LEGVGFKGGRQNWTWLKSTVAIAKEFEVDKIRSWGPGKTADLMTCDLVEEVGDMEGLNGRPTGNAEPKIWARPPTAPSTAMLIITSPFPTHPKHRKTQHSARKPSPCPILKEFNPV